MTQRNRGFTLMEIMIVIAIIALLAAMISPALFNRLRQAETARIAQDIRAIGSALEFFYLDNYRYPGNTEGLEALTAAPDGVDNWNGPYLEELPLDPWGRRYFYNYPGTQGGKFDIYSRGADGREGGEGADRDIGNWNIQSIESGI